jgi:hypothetical protein
MVPRARVLVLALSVLSVVAPLAAADRLRIGEWEFTTTTNGQTRTFQHCVTADDAGSVNGDAKSARAHAEKQATKGCAITDYKVDGNSVSYAMTCGARTIRSTATYHGDTSEGELISKNGSEPEVVSHVKAKRLGDCP